VQGWPGVNTASHKGIAVSVTSACWARVSGNTPNVFDAKSFELAPHMREIRMRHGLFQAEVALRMGLNPSMISLVPGNRVPALAAALGVRVDELRGQTPVCMAINVQIGT
jgi:hypothetical protein